MEPFNVSLYYNEGRGIAIHLRYISTCKVDCRQAIVQPAAVGSLVGPGVGQSLATSSHTSLKHNIYSKSHTLLSSKPQPQVGDSRVHRLCWTNQIPTGIVAVDRHNSTTLILYVQCNCLLI